MNKSIGPKGASDIDCLVGSRVRLRRRQLKMTQEAFGKYLDLSFQQIQKYEMGVNRISSGRLFLIALILGVPVSFFFEGAESHIDLSLFERIRGKNHSLPEPAKPLNADAIEIAQAYDQIENRDLRKDLKGLMKRLATTPVSEKRQ